MNVEDSLFKEFGQLLEELDKEEIIYRTVRMDDTYFVVTSDFKPGRWNLETDNGLVTKIFFG